MKSESNKLKQQLELLAENTNTVIYNQRKHLLGRVLTIVDAVASDPEQRKATKDLIHDLFYQGSYWNDIRWQFNQMAKANGFEFPDHTELPQPPEPVNAYEQL